MPPVPPFAWIALAALLVLASAAIGWRLGRRQRPAARRVPPLPAEWSVCPRPLFTTGERLLRRRLAQAFPQHLVMAKLQLVRFCQPDSGGSMRYWYDLLSPLTVSFAVCSENGRVLAAIDIDQGPADREQPARRRALEIKQAVLKASGVRYALSPAGQLPTVEELHALLPPDGAATPLPDPARRVQMAREQLAQTVASRRRERAASGQDGDFQDSFFSTDSRFGPAGPSGFDILK